MKSKSVLLLSSLFVIIVLCLANVNDVYAYSTVYYTRTKYQDYVYSPNLRTNTLQLSSGKYVSTRIYQGDYVIIEIFNPNGNVYYNITLSAVTDKQVSGTTYRRSYAITEYNGYLYIVYFPTGSGNQYVYVSRIHLTTFVKDDYSYTLATGSNYLYVAEVVYFGVYNNMLYIAYVGRYSTSGNTYIGIIKFNPSTNSFTILTSLSRSDTRTPYTTFSFMDSSGNIYMLISFSDYPTQPNTYKYDFGTNTISIICSAGTSIYPSDGENLRKIYFIDAGIYQSGTYLYLYFTYIYPSSSITLKIICWIQQYNNSISSTNLIAQNPVIANIGTIIPSGLPFALGYGESYNYTYVYYPYKDASNKYLMKNKMYIEDFQNPASAEWKLSYSETSSDNVIYNNGNEYVFKSSANDIYQANYDASNSKQYVYCGLGALQINYDIGITYSPMDNPLKTGTSYAFTITCYENNIATKETIRIIWDNVTIGTYETDAGGKKSFTRVEGVSGVHIMNVAIIKNNNDVYDEEFQYTFTVSEEGGAGSSSQLYGSLSMLMMYLPVLATTLVMGSVGAKLSGGFGFVIGSCLGILICCIAGLLPVYFIIFIGIILSIIVMKG